MGEAEDGTDTNEDDEDEMRTEGVEVVSFSLCFTAACAAVPTVSNDCTYASGKQPSLPFSCPVSQPDSTPAWSLRTYDTKSGTSMT